MNPSPSKLGSFLLTSPKLVITDPGYDEDTASVEGLGCFISPCATGEWDVFLTQDAAPKRNYQVPRSLFAIRAGTVAPDDISGWKRASDGVGGDSGMICVCDTAHFHDDSLVPKDQKWTFDGRPASPTELWYSFICEILGRDLAAMIPHGFAINWDGGMDVDSISAGDLIIAVRLSISGWPERI